MIRGEEKNSIVVCGGHFSPALAVIEKLKAKKKHRIVYIGRKKPLEGDEIQPVEKSVVEKLGIEYYSINTGRLQRTFTRYTLLSLLKIPGGFFQSLVLLFKIKPRLIVSFGGYVALPVCLTAWVMGIPVVTHEQTSVLGLANRLISRIAVKTCLSWPKTKRAKKRKSFVITGNPIRMSIFRTVKTSLNSFGNNNLPLLYITGGSLGARSINNIIAQILPDLLGDFRVLHQCGHADNNLDYKRLISVKNSLPLFLRKNYKVVKNIDPDHVGSILNSASMVISRAGANTVTELLITATPAILIPLAWAAEKEQLQNALVLEKAGKAVVIEQKDLTPKILLKEIITIKKNIQKHKSPSFDSGVSLHKNAADKIVGIIETVLSSINPTNEKA